MDASSSHLFSLYKYLQSSNERDRGFTFLSTRYQHFALPGARRPTNSPAVAPALAEATLAPAPAVPAPRGPRALPPGCLPAVRAAPLETPSGALSTPLDAALTPPLAVPWGLPPGSLPARAHLWCTPPRPQPEPHACLHTGLRPHPLLHRRNGLRRCRRSPPSPSRLRSAVRRAAPPTWRARSAKGSPLATVSAPAAPAAPHARLTGLRAAPCAPRARRPSPHGRAGRATASVPSAAPLALCPSARLCAALHPLPAVRPPPGCARGRPLPSTVPRPAALPRSFQPPVAGEPEGQRQLQ
ncbi:hypothetical protein ACQJBY_068787 [Aegilops geniculata]